MESIHTTTQNIPLKKWETPQVIKIEILANTVSAMTEAGGFGTLGS